MSAQEFEIIVYGATGFTGRLVAEHLLQTYGVDGAYYQDLVGPDRYTLQRPARAWTSTDGELPAGFGWVFDGELSQFYRRDSVDGRRMDLAATIERPLLAHTSPLRASTWARARLTALRTAVRSGRLRSVRLAR